MTGTTCPHCAEIHPTPAGGPITHTIGLAGNPNCGKTTLFNILTGAQQATGNWPGTTVTRKEGVFTVGDHTARLIDLPGTYSLTAYTEDEQVTLDFLMNDIPDLIVVVVDAGNLERNLYLAVQIIETGIPVIIALNMMDEAQARGIHIDTAKLETGLGGTPVIPMTATRRQGLPELMDALARICTTRSSIRTHSLQIAAAR